MIRISILIPCYNAAKSVGDAIRSALAQTWQNKEVIVVDDGSTDDSLAVVRSFGEAIRFETGPNRGGNVARNRLLELAAGEWLQYLDADDFLLPRKIEHQLGELHDAAIVDVAYSPVIMAYWEKSQEMRQEVLPISGPHDPWAQLIRWILPQTGAALWRKAAVAEVGGWKSDQPCCQEHELYFRLLAAGKAFQFCQTAGAVYRQWSTNTVCRKNPLKTFTHRLAIVDAAERHLTQAGEMNDLRRDAIAFTRVECARSLYHLDRTAAVETAAVAARTHPTYKLPPAPCFPRAYRWLHRVAGFQAAELAAGLIRPWRGKRMA